MHTINPNGTTNHKWHIAHNIRQTISSMTESERQNALLRIQAELHVLGNTPPKPELLQYIVPLLNGKRPKRGIARR